MKICVAQMRPEAGDIQANIERHRELIDLAVAHGAQMVFFPELSLTGYEPTLAGKLAMDVDDPRLDVFRQVADDRELVTGIGVPTMHDAGIRISMLVFQPHAPCRRYSKQYLHPDEAPYFVAGRRADVVIASPVALAICYELSIAEHALRAAVGGASVYVASVAKSVDGMDRAFERLATIAREHGMTVLMANCIGVADGVLCGGRSAAWDAKGRLMGQLDATSEGVLVCDTVTATVVVATR